MFPTHVGVNRRRLDHLPAGETQPPQAVPDRPDHLDRCVVGVERRGPSRLVLLVSQQILELGPFLGPLLVVVIERRLEPPPPDVLDQDRLLGGVALRFSAASWRRVRIAATLLRNLVFSPPSPIAAASASVIR